MYTIFTEIINCGKIGKIALDSFHKYHNLPVTVYGREEDFFHLTPNPNNRLVVVDDTIYNGFKQGHLGTARVWNKVITEPSTNKTIIHFDSDVIFRDNVVNDIIEQSEYYDLIGAIRSYKNNPQHRDDIRHLPDLCATALFSFNKEKIGNWGEKLVDMIRGTYMPYKHPHMDYFDPVMFDIIYNGGTVKHLDFNEVGGCNFFGSRDNEYKEYNNMDTPFKIEFGSKLAHFSAVGSGMNIYNNKDVNIPESYKQYALDRYALFCKIFYNEDLGIDVSKYESLLKIERWY